MATLSKHGDYIIVKQTWSHRAFCSDGTVLINQGFGWKVQRKLREIDYKTAANRLQEVIEALRPVRPMFTELDRLLDKIVPSLKRRIYLKESLRYFAHDPEAVRAQSQEDKTYGADLSLEEAAQICLAYQLAKDEEAFLRNNQIKGE